MLGRTEVKDWNLMTKFVSLSSSSWDNTSTLEKWAVGDVSKMLWSFFICFLDLTNFIKFNNLTFLHILNPNNGKYYNMSQIDCPRKNELQLSTELHLINIIRFYIKVANDRLLLLLVYCNLVCLCRLATI